MYRRYQSVLIIGLTLFSFNLSPVRAAVSVEMENAVKNCLAAQPEKAAPENKKSGPLRYVLNGLKNETKASLSGMGKDMVFVFSCQDIDPYAKKAPTNKPYVDLSIRLVDGTICKLVKYPDNSAKIEGGFADGTIIAPLSGNTFAVGYPNGVYGRLEKLPAGGFKIYRPDNTITTLQKSASGRYHLRNTKFGYMGEAIPDRTGLQFELER